MHIRWQLLLESDRPGGHVQLMSSVRQLAYEAERRKAVAVRQVVCKQRRRGNDEEAERHSGSMDGSPWPDPHTSGSLNFLPSPENSTTYGIEPATREHVSLLGVLRRRAWIIVLVTLLAGGAAAAFAFATRNTYDSTAKLLFRQTLGAELNALGLLPPTTDADNLALDNVEVVGSRRVADATATRLRALGEDVNGKDVADDVTVALAKNTDVVDVTAQGHRSRGRGPAGDDLRGRGRQDRQRATSRRRRYGCSTTWSSSTTSCP